jgi:hypothetical protein
VASVPGGAITITITTHQTVLLQIPNGTQVDRVMMREDQVGIETPSSVFWFLFFRRICRDRLGTTKRQEISRKRGWRGRFTFTQTAGQIIRSYDVEAEYPAGVWTKVSSGQSIGNKRIDVVGPSLHTATAVRLRVTGLAPGLAVAKLTHFGAYSECDDDSGELRPFSRVHFTGNGN